MALTYYNASNAIRTTIPKDAYRKDYDAICSDIFDNSDNIYYNEIMYEQTYGQRNFKAIPMVRVDSVIKYNTGIQIGDDYKVLIFPPNSPIKPSYGMKFKWGRNYWLVVNTDNLGGLSTSCEIRRCNNVLRFFDANGNKIYEPCILDQVLRFTNNNDTSTIVTGKGEQYIWCQRNTRTTILKPNDRMLFGVPEQRIGFRIYAGGFGNSLNTITGDDNSPTLTQFYVEEYEIDYQTDDVQGGFANARKYQYTIDIDNNNTTFDVGTNYTLNASVYNGGDIVNKSVVWTSGDSSIASINNNVLTAISAGETTITATMADNTGIYGTLDITVQNSGTGTDVYDIIISPNKEYILQGSTQKFDVSLYKNGVIQTDSLSIVDVSSSVPKDNYSLSVSGNSFTLTNKKVYIDEPVKVQCSSTECTKTFEIRLRGVY